MVTEEGGKQRAIKRKLEGETRRFTPSSGCCLGGKPSEKERTPAEEEPEKMEAKGPDQAHGGARTVKAGKEQMTSRQPEVRSVPERSRTGAQVRPGEISAKKRKDNDREAVMERKAEEEKEKEVEATTAVDGRKRPVSTRITENEIKKELILLVETDGEEEIQLIDLLKAIEMTCGRVLGCRTKGEKKWELTMSNPRGKEKLLDGFKIKNTKIIATELVQDTRVVSFLNLPLYITDQQIEEKLLLWGVEPASEIRRRKWPGTEILDGTRFLKVKFPDNISSLPYSTKFDTVEGAEHFRVLHDRQLKVCRMCLHPGHILRECPDFCCFRCKRQGHYARECTTTKERHGERETEETQEQREAEERSGETEKLGSTSASGGFLMESGGAAEMGEESEVEVGRSGEEESGDLGSESENAGRRTEGGVETRDMEDTDGRRRERKQEKKRAPACKERQVNRKTARTTEESGMEEEDEMEKWTGVRKLQRPDRGKKKKANDQGGHQRKVSRT